MKRSIVYIDGFNLYYGAIKGGPHKWLNLELLFKRLRQADKIEHIYYFTAMVTGPSQIRQQTYIDALATLPLVSVVLGKFKRKQVTCKSYACTNIGDRVFTMPEEKRTDVNIAVQMLDDAYQDACDRFILVSGDSDLVPSVNRIKERFPEKEVIVYVPSRTSVRGAAVELRSSADHARDFPLNLLKISQFPAEVISPSKGVIRKPSGW